MERRLFSGLLICGVLLAGCATKDKPAGAAPAPTPAPAQAPPPEAAAPKKPWYSWLGSLSPSHLAGKMMPKKAKPPQAEPARLIGTVKMVNKDDHFVLIDAISYGATQPGDALVCIANQRESANLRASALRNPPFLIADIASGSPSPGDKVYKR